MSIVSRISLTPLSKIIINDYSYKLPFRLETFSSSLGDFMILYTVTYDNLKQWCQTNLFDTKQSNQKCKKKKKEKEN